MRNQAILNKISNHAIPDHYSNYRPGVERDNHASSNNKTPTKATRRSKFKII